MNKKFSKLSFLLFESVFIDFIEDDEFKYTETTIGGTTDTNFPFNLN